ncbi:unnamed protein product [Caretta caretta]
MERTVRVRQPRRPEGKCPRDGEAGAATPGPLECVLRLLPPVIPHSSDSQRRPASRGRAGLQEPIPAGLAQGVLHAERQLRNEGGLRTKGRNVTGLGPPVPFKSFARSIQAEGEVEARNIPWITYEKIPLKHTEGAI